MTKKHLISAAALLAMAGAANAEMTIYGLIDMSYGQGLIDNLSINGADFHLDGCSGALLAGKLKADVHSGGDDCSSQGNSTTRIGFKGTTDVGGGVKANFKLESSGIQSNGEKNGALFGRQAWLGFSGGFGEVRVGRQDSVPFQVMGDFDFNGQSNGVSAGAYSGVGSWATGRQSRSIQYIAPTGGGLTAQFGLVVKGNQGSGAKDVFSAAVKYAAGPVLVGAAYQSKSDSTTTDFKSIAGSYDFGPAKVMASYADGGFNPLGTQTKGYVLGVVAPVAGFSIGANYADGKSKDASATKIKSWELFLNKEVFKNTYGYAEYGDWKADSNVGPVSAKTTGYALGVIFVF